MYWKQKKSWHCLIVTHHDNHGASSSSQNVETNEDCEFCGMTSVVKQFHLKICEGYMRQEATASLPHITDDYQHSSSSSQYVERNTVHIPTQFVDCGPTIKEEIKEENVEFHDPLRLSYAVQSLDEPVTYEEFFV